MRFDRCSAHRRFVVFLGALAVLGVATAALSKGEVMGKVVDREGKPVKDLTVRLTQQGAEDDARTIEVRKKGRFFARGLPRGRYTIDLVDSDLFVAQVDYRVRRDDGLTLGEGSLEGDPRQGAVGVPMSDQTDLDLTVVVAPRASGEAQQRALAVALPALAAAAKLYNEERYEEVVAETERILAEDPNVGEAWYVNGLALEKTGRYEQAEAALQQAAGRIPDYENIWGYLGEISMRLAADLETRDRRDEARQAYARAADALDAALERNPESLALRLNLAASLDRTGEDDRLLPVLEQILDRDPSNLQARLRLASLYARQGRHESAIEILDAMPATDKRAAVTIYNIAVRLNEDGDAEGSMLAARRAAQIDPELPHPRRLIAQLLLGKGDHPAAMQAIRELLEVAPDDPEAETYRRILEQLAEP